MSAWFYEDKGQRIGPVSTEEMHKLYSDGKILTSTLVWMDDFGASWKQLQDTVLYASASLPPPIPAKLVGGAYAWILAFLPIIGALIIIILRHSFIVPSSLMIFAAYFIVNSLLVLIDANIIDKSGRNTKGLYLRLWIIFVPVYLFQRSRVLHERQYMVIVWIVSFVISIFVQSPRILSEPIYFGSSIPQCDSHFEKNMVLRLFRKIEFIKVAGISGVSVNNIVHVNPLSTISENRHDCSATVMGSDGKAYSVRYSVSKDKDGQIYTRVQVSKPSATTSMTSPDNSDTFLSNVAAKKPRSTNNTSPGVDSRSSNVSRSTTLVRLLPDKNPQALINIRYRGADAGSSSIRIWTTNKNGSLKKLVFSADEPDGSLSVSLIAAKIKIEGMRMAGCMACGQTEFAIWAWDANLGGFALWQPSPANVDFANYLNAPVALYGADQSVTQDLQLNKYRKVTAELDAKYQHLLLSFDTNDAAKLKKNELKWIERKRRQCGSTTTALAPGQLAALDCLISETVNRLDDIGARED